MVQDTSKNYYILLDEVQFAISDEDGITTIGLFDFLDDMNSLEL